MGRSNSYTSNRRVLGDAEIVELYAQLQDADLVGLRAGCSNTTVLAIVRAAGQPVAPRGGRAGRRRIMPAIPDELIIELYTSGMSAADVGERAGCSADAVYRILRAADVPRRSGAVGLRRRYRAPG